jgi:hypothetical protein
MMAFQKVRRKVIVSMGKSKRIIVAKTYATNKDDPSGPSSNMSYMSKANKTSTYLKPDEGGILHMDTLSREDSS